MPRTILLGLILNAGLLLALAVVVDLLSARTSTGRSWVGRTLAGLAAGLIGIGLMAAPIHVEPGVQFDTRSVLLSVCGVFLGPWATALAIAMTGAFRVWLGGAWVIGVLVILASGSIGLLWRARLCHITARRPALSLYSMGVAAHIVMLMLIALIPEGAGLRALPQVFLPVIVVYPLATVALGLLLTQRVEREASVARELELQAHYFQAQKMEGVGRLAAGVAHDFNNLLTIITGSADLAASALPEGHPAQEDLRQILAAGERAGALTRQLLAFSRQAVVMPVELNLDEVIEGFRPMLSRILREHVALELRLGLPTTRVRADAGQLEQVILNLAINARDAMPAGGLLTIETGPATLIAPEAEVLHPPVPPGRYARVSVIDTGEGMDAATLDRLFEPFFTTKPMGKGTGLGLATVSYIVEKSAGGVRVTSAPGRGARFDVFLPEVLERAASPAVDEPRARPSPIQPPR